MTLQSARLPGRSADETLSAARSTMSERKRPGQETGGLLDVSSALSAALADVEALAAEKERSTQRQTVQEVLAEREASGAPAVQPDVRGMTIEQVAEVRGVSVEELSSQPRPAQKDSKEVAPPVADSAQRAQFANAGNQLADARRRADLAEAQLAEARADLAANRRRFQRLTDRHAEQQTRMQRQEQELPERLTQNMVAAILPALDAGDAVAAQLLTGGHLDQEERTALEMLAAQWLRALQGLGVQVFDAVGQQFDPAIHEAISREDRPDVLPGRVLRQVGRGYLLGGRLLRSAQVVVNSPQSEADGAV